MAKVTANISVDADIKAKAQELFSDLGLDFSTAVNIFLRTAVRENGFPFELTRNIPNRTTEKATSDAEAGVDMYGPFDSVDALMEALNA